MAKKATSVQKATNADPQIGGITLPLSFFTSADIVPEWESNDRDSFLRVFWKRFGADMLQGVIATVVAKVQTQNWELEGPKRLVSMYHQIIRDDSDFHRGYDSLVSRGLQDYYTQDNGWFMERQRSGPSDRDGPCLGLSHLDSARMRPTGNNEYPYAYEDVLGEYHLMHRSQYIRIVDLPTPATNLYSDERGFCALSRCLSTAMILIMLTAMKREKLADLPPSALAIFNNISRKQFENSLRLHGAQDDMKNNMIWRQLLPLFGIDPAHEARVQFISLREVWEGYDDQTAMDIAAYSFAAGFRLDPREFWPVSQGPMGTGKEAEVQHQKAKAKAHGLLFTQLERNWNSSHTLPDRVTFRFVIQDIDEEEQRAKIYSQQIDNVEGMQKAGAQLTPQEVRYLFCKQYKILPKILLQVPEEGEVLDLTLADVYMDDVERQAKEFGGWYFGPVVKMLSDGTLIESDYRKNGLFQGRKELVDGPLYIGDIESLVVIMAEKGGAGSGNWGHTGRPGIRGGSGGSGGAGVGKASLKSEIISLRPELATVAQKIYDAWEQDEEGADVDYGCGGICDAVAMEMGGIIAELEGVEVRDGGQPGDDHAWLIVYDPNTEEVLGVDIPPGVYETGGGYSWTKIPDVTITPNDIDVFDTGYTMEEVENWLESGEGWEVDYNELPVKKLKKQVIFVRGELPPKMTTKELTLQTLAKDFSCCPSHAAQEFPGLIDNLRDLGYISSEEAYAADMLPLDNVFAVATGLKETKQGDDLLMYFTRGLRRQLGLRDFLLGEKQHRGLETINRKIAVMPRPVAIQIRKASTDLFDAMSGKDRQQAIRDIPDEVWEEAQRKDLLDDQPEEVVVATS